MRARGAILLARLFSAVIILSSRMLNDNAVESYSIVRRPAAGVREANKVLVIGGAGYLGTILSRQLLDAGCRARVLDSLLFGDSAGSELAGHLHFERLRAAFRRVESLVKAIHNIDAVIHLAAIVGDPACAMKVDLTTEIKPCRYASRTIVQSRVAR
jgi:hypothetical protein